ncbi:MAG: hypothetical protein ACRDGV_01495 [Candidatus Limnocylindria bacterium]
MSFLDKARQAAEQARQAATQGIAQATSPESQAQMRKTGLQLRDAAGQAKRGLITAVEKIDPAILADIIIKATALQERANDSLRTKGSIYRIGEITITASIPPQIGFSIIRIGDLEETVHDALDSSRLVAEVPTAGAEVVSLSGDVVSPDGEVPPPDSDLEGLQR